MTNERGCWCRHCKAELPPDHKGPCPRCGKRGKDCKESASVAIGLVAFGNSRARSKQEGFKKFSKEVLQGLFPSFISRWVYKERIIDKERNEYHETVKDAMTGEVIRDIHEPLSQHKSRQKQRGLEKGAKEMGTKGRRNIKKPKKPKDKKK